MGWSTENLGELYKIGSSKRVLKSQWQTSGVPFYRGREITVLSNHGQVSNELFISEELYQEHAKKHGVPSSEDIVITAIGTIGNSYIVSENDRFYFKDASVLWLKKTSSVNSSFINLWLKSPLMREQLDEGNGATVDTLTIKKLQSLKVKLPPIPEQQRIVAILDQAFADIEKARANAEKNLKNARELFDSYLNQVFSQRGEGWIEEPLKNIATITMGQSPKGSSYNTAAQGTPLINGPVEFGPYAFSKTLRTKFTTEPTKMCNAGDLILCVRGSTTGRMNIAGFDACIGRGVAAISSSDYQEWLNHYINFQRDNIYKLGTGATFPNISSSILGDFIVVIPPFDEMDDVLNLIVSLKQSCEKLCVKYLSKLKSLEELKKSLLQKAFSGELTKSKGIAA